LADAGLTHHRAFHHLRCFKTTPVIAEGYDHRSEREVKQLLDAVEEGLPSNLLA